MSEDNDDIFSSIAGHEGAQAFISAALRKGEPHVLMHGPPGCGKSAFGLAMDDAIPGVDYRDCRHVTPSKLREALRADPPILILDEIDSLSEKGYGILNTPLERGVVEYDSPQGDTYQEEIRTQVFAMCNWPKELPDDVRDRFRKVEFEAYDDEEFLEVCEVMLVEQVDWVEEPKQGRAIGRIVQSQTGENDAREARDLARLGNDVREVKQLASARHNPDAEMDVEPLSVTEVAAAQDELEREELTKTLARELVDDDDAEGAESDEEPTGEEAAESSELSGENPQGSTPETDTPEDAVEEAVEEEVQKAAESA